MTTEDDLRGRLGPMFDRTASAVRVRPDAADLLHRVERRSRNRTRLLGSALALALVAGPTAGYLAGDRPGELTGVAAERTTTTDDNDNDNGVTVNDDADDWVATSGGATGPHREQFDPWGYGAPLEFLGTATSNGLTVRFHRVTTPTPDDGNPTWEAPVGCFATGTLLGEASTDRMVTTAVSELFGTGGVEGVVNLVGSAEGDPHWLATGISSAARVDVTFSDGTTVTAERAGEAFVAAAPATGVEVTGPSDLDPTATVVADGEQSELQWWVSTEVWEGSGDACTAPPASLPEPGEQPADPEAARAAIVQVYLDAYNGRRDETQSEAFEDPEALAEVVAALDANDGFNQNYRGTLTAVVTEIVFDTPTHAWLFYDLSPAISGLVGEAVLTERGWKVANATICADIARAGTPCDPDQLGS